MHPRMPALDRAGCGDQPAALSESPFEAMRSDPLQVGVLRVDDFHTERTGAGWTDTDVVEPEEPAGERMLVFVERLFGTEQKGSSGVPVPARGDPCFDFPGQDDQSFELLCDTIDLLDIEADRGALVRLADRHRTIGSGVCDRTHEPAGPDRGAIRSGHEGAYGTSQLVQGTPGQPSRRGEFVSAAVSGVREVGDLFGIEAVDRLFDWAFQHDDVSGEYGGRESVPTARGGLLSHPRGGCPP